MNKYVLTYVMEKFSPRNKCELLVFCFINDKIFITAKTHISSHLDPTGIF